MGHAHLKWAVTLCLVLLPWLVLPLEIFPSGPVVWNVDPEISITRGLQRINMKVKLLNACQFFHFSGRLDGVDECSESYNTDFIRPLEKLCPIETLKNQKYKPRVTQLPEISSRTVEVTIAAGTNAAISNTDGYNLSTATMLKLIRDSRCGGSPECQILIENKDIEHFTQNTFSVLHAFKNNIIKAQQVINRQLSAKNNLILPEFLHLFGFDMSWSWIEDFQSSIAEFRSCSMSDNRYSITIDFWVPEVDRNFFVLNSNYIRSVYETNEAVCERSYNGPSRIVYGVQEKCVMSTDRLSMITPRLGFVAPFSRCLDREMVEKVELFSTVKCKPRSSEDYARFIAVLPQGDILLVYCPKQRIALPEGERSCPEDMFYLPADTKFSINGIEFFGYKRICNPTGIPDRSLSTTINEQIQIIYGHDETGGAIAEEQLWGWNQQMLIGCVFVLSALLVLSIITNVVLFVFRKRELKKNTLYF